jgi:hypothetical protein
VFRDLSEGSWGGLSTSLEERTSSKTRSNDLLSLFNDVLGLVVFFLFLSPFLISVSLSLIKLMDLSLEEVLEFLLILKEMFLLISDGDLLFKFSLKFL